MKYIYNFISFVLCIILMLHVSHASVVHASSPFAPTGQGWNDILGWVEMKKVTYVEGVFGGRASFGKGDLTGNIYFDVDVNDASRSATIKLDGDNIIGAAPLTRSGNNIGWVYFGDGDFDEDGNDDYTAFLNGHTPSVSLDPNTGIVSGSAWIPNYGWLRFSNPWTIKLVPNIPEKVSSLIIRDYDSDAETITFEFDIPNNQGRDLTDFKLYAKSNTDDSKPYFHIITLGLDDTIENNSLSKKCITPCTFTGDLALTNNLNYDYRWIDSGSIKTVKVIVKMNSITNVTDFTIGGDTNKKANDYFYKITSVDPADQNNESAKSAKGFMYGDVTTTKGGTHDGTGAARNKIYSSTPDYIIDQNDGRHIYLHKLNSSKYPLP